MACWPVTPYCRVAMPRRPRSTSPSSMGGPGPAMEGDHNGPDARTKPRAPETELVVDAALLEKWALSYLGRFASSAENLRQVLGRRARRRRGGQGDGASAANPLIDALIARYEAAGLLDDAAYA